jgi:hypothetical protein
MSKALCLIPSLLCYGEMMVICKVTCSYSTLKNRDVKSILPGPHWDFTSRRSLQPRKIPSQQWRSGCRLKMPWQGRARPNARFMEQEETRGSESRMAIERQQSLIGAHVGG